MDEALRNKVLLGLQCCNDSNVKQCSACPYFGNGWCVDDLQQEMTTYLRILLSREERESER